LFSKRAKLYKERDLKNENLTENDIKQLILEHYTFLSRPVIVNNNEIFIGNSKKTVEAAKKSIHG
jgi:arsenate reductase